MASPTPKRNQNRPEQTAQSTFSTGWAARKARDAAPPETINPRWLAKALALTVVAALVCAWLAICLLVYQGSWQLYLHPVKRISATPAGADLAFDAIRFDSGPTGTPRLSGWWIPSGAGSTASSPTLLFLHGGSGSLSDEVEQLAQLHGAGVNLFAIDYRGFGSSDPAHPSEARMDEDAAAALDYLTATRHLPAASVVPFGVGLGASVAAQLAATHPELTAVILDNADPDATLRPIRETKAHLIPLHLLAGDQFDIGAQLPRVRQPKLLIEQDLPASTGASPAHERALLLTAPDPKTMVTLPAGATAAAKVEAVRRFLDEYVSAPHR